MKYGAQPDKIAAVAKSAGLGLGIYRLVKTCAITALVIIILISLMPHGVPWHIVALAIAGACLLIVLQTISLTRLARVDTASAPSSRVAVDISPNEKLAGYVAGIMRVGAWAGGYAILGTGKIKNTENALLVTNRNVLAVTVPLAGAGKIMAGTNISLWQWLASSKKIRDWLEAALKAKPLAEVVRDLPINQAWSWGTMGKVETDERTQSIFLANPGGQKTRYSIRDKDEFQKAKALFKV